MHFFGIRHHGPGSAHALLRALEEVCPDVVLVEAPGEAEKAVLSTDLTAFEPPVAFLLYNPKNLREAFYFPFADYSPEWQALLWARRHGVPVRFMDLSPFYANTVAGKERQSYASDPFSEIAALDGYSDAERWWEARVERSGSQSAIESFGVVQDLMRALREAQPDQSQENLLREACMRKTIREVRKAGFKNPAVVCGAWHVPALEAIDAISAKNDEKLLKNLPKPTKCCFAWIPWSFSRLSAQSGYGAGVTAPAWYQILWQHPNDASVQWMARAARLLREHDLSASAAQVIDAGRLADALAVLRGSAQPGIEELREAANSVLSQGNDTLFKLLDNELVVGNAIGNVPHQPDTLPLLADFEAQVKRCRLKRDTNPTPLKLDLRNEAHLNKSRVLHRLNALDVPWGTEEDDNERRHGSFTELWRLQWKPDFTLNLIEAAVWGNTMAEAAQTKLSRQVQEASSLTALVQYLQTVLKADIPALLPQLLAALQAESAEAFDALLLAEVVPVLVSTIRYGSARQLDVHLLEVLIADLAPRTCVLFPGACTGVTEEAAENVMVRLLMLHHSIDILNDDRFTPLWQEALLQISRNPNTARLLAGLSCRLLFDNDVYNADTAGKALRLECSGLPRETASWLAGFLHGNALLLLHHPPLWHMLNEWVGDLSDQSFVELLPLLRRTFSSFSGPERRRLMDLASTKTENQSNGIKWDPKLTEQVQGIIDMILTNPE